MKKLSNEFLELVASGKEHPAVGWEYASMASELLQLRHRVAEIPMLDMRVLNNTWHGLRHTPENEDHFVNCHICGSVYEVECYLQKYYIVPPLPPQESEKESEAQE